MRNNAFVLLVSTLVTAVPGPAFADDLSCQNYAEQSLKQIAEAKQLGCERTTGDFWAPNQIYQYNQCMKHGAQAAQIAMVNLGTRESELEFCRKQKAAAAPPQAEEPQDTAAATDDSTMDEPADDQGGGGGNTARVNGDVDLYDEPGGDGNKIGVLREDDEVAVMNCREDQWCKVSGGWVWGEFLDR